MNSPAAFLTLVPAGLSSLGLVGRKRSSARLDVAKTCNPFYLRSSTQYENRAARRPHVSLSARLSDSSEDDAADDSNELLILQPPDEQESDPDGNSGRSTNTGPDIQLADGPSDLDDVLDDETRAQVLDVIGDDDWEEYDVDDTEPESSGLKNRALKDAQSQFKVPISIFNPKLAKRALEDGDEREDESPVDPAWRPFRWGEHEVFAFWDFDTMNSDELEMEEVVARVKKLLSCFGFIRGIYTYGNLMVDYDKVESLIDEKRQLMRRMMWLKELPPPNKRIDRLYKDGEEEPYDPGFRIEDVDPNEFFNDGAFDQVYLTKVKLKCELCNRKEMKKMKQLIMHFMSKHSVEMNERAKESIDFFRPYEWWWNDEDQVAKFMYALSCIGVRSAKVDHVHVNYYIAKLGLKFNKIRGQKKEALPSRFRADMFTSMKRWAKRMAGAKPGKKGPPLIAIISDERGKLIGTIKEIKARYEGVTVIVVRPKAARKPYQWADYNFDWDDVMEEKYRPIGYDDATLEKYKWDESELIAMRNRRPTKSELRRRRRGGTQVMW